MLWNGFKKGSMILHNNIYETYNMTVIIVKFIMIIGFISKRITISTHFILLPQLFLNWQLSTTVIQIVVVKNQ